MQNKYSKICAYIVFIISLTIILFVSFSNKLFTNLLFEIQGKRNLTDTKKQIITAETNYIKSFKHKYQFLEIYGAYAKLSNLLYLNNVLKLNDGFIYSNIAYKPDKQAILKNAYHLNKLKKYLYDYSIPVHISIFPSILDNKNIKFPSNFVDYTEYNTNLFLSKLGNYNIDYLDFRPFVEEGDPSYHFFKTDNHWTPRFAFDVFKKIAKVFQNEYSISYLPQSIDFNNYSSHTYKNIFLGSQGKRVGKVYAGLDDVELITPNFKNNIHRTRLIEPYYTVKDEDIKTNYNSAFINKNLLQGNFYTTSSYDAYGGRVGVEKYINANKNAKGRIMIIGDSFVKPLRGFYALAYKEVYVLDPRSEEYSSYNIYNLIERIMPDVVSFQYNVKMLTNNKLFSFY